MFARCCPQAPCSSAAGACRFFHDHETQNASEKQRRPQVTGPPPNSGYKAADDASQATFTKLNANRSGLLSNLPCVRPASNTPRRPAGPQGSSLVGPDARFSPSSRRRLSSIETHDTHNRCVAHRLVADVVLG